MQEIFLYAYRLKLYSLTMLSISHTVISLPFGVYLDNPYLIFASAFIFHLFADTLLHWNIYPDNFKRYTFYALAGLDVIGGLLVAWMVMANQFLTTPILVAMLGGNMPDIMQGLWDMLPSRGKHSFRAIQPFFDFHDKLQLETRDPVRGLVWQIGLIIIALVFIVKEG